MDRVKNVVLHGPVDERGRKVNEASCRPQEFCIYVKRSPKGTFKSKEEVKGEIANMVKAMINIQRMEREIKQKIEHNTLVEARCGNSGIRVFYRVEVQFPDQLSPEKELKPRSTDDDERKPPPPPDDDYGPSL